MKTLLLIGLLAVVLLAWPSGESQQQEALYDGVALDEHLLKLDKIALEQAYHQHMVKLFTVWITSGAPREAAQFRSGIHIARRAYHQVATEIGKREKAIIPPP